jgi:prophage regulatory protein
MTGTSTDRILRLNAVLDRTGLSRATLYRKIQGGTFPKQVRIAARCTGWHESAVNEWMHNPMFYTVGDGVDAPRRHRCAIVEVLNTT